MSQYDDAKKKESLKQLVTFTINTEEYGLEILKVQEVVRLPHITRLPRAPIFIKGVINLRGNIIPIIDLREKFGMEAKKYSETTRVIIVEVAEKRIGMIVDNVSQVVRVNESDVAPPPPMISGITNEYLSGVVRLEDRLIILLKVDDILSTEEVIQLEQTNYEHIKETIER
ncbi:MAG: chemotaxis protein CheW [Spirochaetota bacterium]|nr:chemotaxis protein CheW [Spirochaetota bacterium]